MTREITQDGAPQGGLVPHSPWVYWPSFNLFKFFARVWFRQRATGTELVPATGGVILVCNHSSYLDPMLMGIELSRQICYLAQKGLAKLPPIRWWMRKVGVVLVDRAAPSRDVLRRLEGHLIAGGCTCMFPEGTRSKDGTVGPFRPGVEFLVRRTGALVVPVGLEGMSRAMPRGALIPRPFRTRVHFGAPWSPEQVLAEGGMEALRRRVAELARAPLRAEEPTATESVRAMPQGIPLPSNRTSAEVTS